MGELEKKSPYRPGSGLYGLKIYELIINRLDSSSHHNTQPATPKSKGGVGRKFVCGEMSHRRLWGYVGGWYFRLMCCKRRVLSINKKGG
jgi:hypothetical protein